MFRITLKYGANSWQLRIDEGETPQDLYDDYEAAFGLPDNPAVRIDNEEARMDDSLSSSNSTVEFYKPSGTKG